MLQAEKRIEYNTLSPWECEWGLEWDFLEMGWEGLVGFFWWSGSSSVLAMDLISDLLLVK